MTDNAEIDSARRSLVDRTARWACGFINASEVVDAATDALILGLDSPTLRVLAGVPAAQATIEVPDLVERAMDELELPYFGPGHPTNRLIAAAALAAEHVHGTLTARDLCRIVHQHYGHGAHDLIEPLAELDDCYDTIEYSNDTEQDLEQQTLEAARNLIDAVNNNLGATSVGSDADSRIARGREPLA